ncbi:MAG: PEGA domain-containing protein [Desulfobulbaceae bacterium]|nr:PEGA domain-containing protein [Desulfobulbaceae bacterium]MCK5340967.1 PEGA domain-containing protein [Desulfobulbaceae bacterium]MCK5404876.1 PEGA domain-containing protein [Desulfobulbaceae bacterium]
MIRKFTPLILALFFLSSCAQKTIFVTEPPGALVYVDGAEVGASPCDYQYQSGLKRNFDIEIREDGYETVRATLQTQEVDRESRLKWVAAGIIWSPLWLGVFFTQKLKDGYNFVLNKKEEPIFVAQAQDETLPTKRPYN